VKKIVLATILAVVSVVIVTGWVLPKKEAVKALSVNDLRSDPSAFTGPLTITGIMAVVSAQDPKVFGIMDKSELLCTIPGCQKFYLQVRYDGPSPAIGDEVLVTGTFIAAEGNWIFSAATLNVLRNHKL
jgi:hypothetical protein